MIIIKKSVFLIISILAIAALAVCGVIVTKRLNNNANPDYIPPPPVPELKTGNYYLNGDKNSGLWVEVYSDYLTLNGDDVDASIKASMEADGMTPEDWYYQRNFEERKKILCGKKRYSIKAIVVEDYFVEVNTKSVTDEELSQPQAVLPDYRDDNGEYYVGKEYNSYRGLPYNGKDTITDGYFGDFILVD